MSVWPPESAYWTEDADGDPVFPTRENRALLDERHVDTLRRAARKLRDRAERTRRGLRGMPFPSDDSIREAYRRAFNWDPPDILAIYMASMTPEVGLAMAGLFERTADTFLGSSEAGGSRDRLEHFADQMEIVRVARLYLGESK